MAIGPNPQMALTALNRFGMGARPGDLEVAAGDPRGFLMAEASIRGIALLDRPDLVPTRTALQALFQDQEMKRLEREKNPPGQKLASASPSPAPSMGGEMASGQSLAQPAAPAGTAPAMTSPPTVGADGKPKPAEPPIEQRMFRAEALARMQKQANAQAGFVERLVAFWSNHFCVSLAKDQFVRVSAGPFEREAIRPHVLGRFADMLKAVEQHPAMLHYLDNQLSIGPNSQAGRNRAKGLNENLAREILELHTLGVSGGYTQADVTSLARMITGWTLAGREGRLGEPGTFVFVPNWHEPGPQILLGKPYADAGLNQGETALADIARVPATATHIATKLVRHFVADDPPPALVTKLAKTFRDTDGDLKAVTLALIDGEMSWTAPLTKMRTPYEFLIATTRALSRAPEDPGPLINALNAMGMGLWQPPSPNGFPDTAAAWASPEGMKLRLDVSAQIAQRVRDLGNPLALLDTVAGAAASTETRDAVSRAESRQQALALVFMSPEFQRR